MIKHGLENINLEDPIKDKLPKLIDYFVKFYGEEYRQKITDNLNHTIFLYLSKPEHDELLALDIYFAQKREEIIYDYYDNNNLNSFTIDEFPQIDIDGWIKKLDAGEKLSGTLLKFVQEACGFSQTNTFAILNDSTSKKMLKNVLQSFKKDFDECLSNLAYLSSERNRIAASMEKECLYRKNLTDEYNQNCNQILEDFIKSTLKPQKIEKFSPFLENFRDIIMLDPAFRCSHEKEKLKEIYEKCVKDNCDVSYEEFEKLTTDSQITNPLLALKKDFQENLLKSYPCVNKVLGEIKNKGLFEGSIISSVYDYITSRDSNIIAFVEPTYYAEKPDELYFYCVVPKTFFLSDDSLIHELNHIVQSSLISNTDTNLVVKTGLQVANLEKELLTTIGSERESLVNEVVNDYLALQITKMLKKDDFSVGLAEYSPSAYTTAFPLLKDFIEGNKKEIIDCAMSKNKDLAQLIGLKNFDIIANATKNILLNGNSKQMFENLTSRLGLKNIYDVIDLDDVTFTDDEQEYLNNFRQTSYLLNKINLAKIRGTLNKKDFRTAEESKPEQRGSVKPAHISPERFSLDENEK